MEAKKYKTISITLEADKDLSKWQQEWQQPGLKPLSYAEVVDIMRSKIRKEGTL